MAYYIEQNQFLYPVSYTQEAGKEGGRGGEGRGGEGKRGKGRGRGGATTSGHDLSVFMVEMG